MTHLTHTGIDAGKTLCGQRKEATDQGLHYQYADDIQRRPQVYQPLCPMCDAIYNDEANWE